MHLPWWQLRLLFDDTIGGNMNRDDEGEDTTIYKVVMNHEEQYSIWPADRENALGWRDAGKSGTKAECLAYIKEVWTDMRPLSLRKRMEEGSSS
jgi:MbtH protein